MENNENFVIEGGYPLLGTVYCNGAKNSILPLIAAAIAIKAKVTFLNVPHIKDLDSLLDLIKCMGVKIITYSEGVLVLDSSGPLQTRVENSNGYSLRGTQTLLGALLGREHNAMIPSLGGCSIGARPIDIHLKGLKALGSEFEWKDGYLVGHTSELCGNDIYLDFPSVGATENLLLAAVFAKGTTHLYNAAQEPEIYDLISFLNKAGARIVQLFPFGFLINGFSDFHNVSHNIIGDRIEASTFMIASAITKGEITVKGIDTKFIWSIITKLRETGAIVEPADGDGVLVKGTNSSISTDIRTFTFPGFPTDVQPQFSAYLTLVQGNSVITENIFENRFGFASDLQRMGANIKVKDYSAIIEGVPALHSAVVQAKDLRGGAALVLAGLATEGTTTVKSIQHIDRGYDSFDAKLTKLGAHIIRSL